MNFPPKREDLSPFYFFLIGFWTNTPMVMVLWVGLNDILSGTLWPTTVILVAFSIGDILVKVVSPAVVSRISFHLSFALLTVLYVASILLLVVIDDVRLRITAVAIFGLSYAFKVTVCMKMLAYYKTSKLLVTAYQSGRSCSVFFNSLGYTGLTTWLCVAPRIVFSMCIPISFFPLGIYILLDKEPLKNHLKRTASVVHYSKLQEEECYDDKEDHHTHELTTTFRLVKSFPLFMYGHMMNFSLQLSMAAILTTLTFPSSPFPPRDHFQYYRLISDGGILVGSWFGFAGHKFSHFSGLRNTGITVSIVVFHSFIFLLSSWYRFMPNVIPVFVLCCTQGVAFCITYIQILTCAANLFSNPRDKGTALNTGEVGISVGRTAAAFLGIFVEKNLREHCTNNLMLGEYCLARIPSSAGWTSNLICKK